MIELKDISKEYSTKSGQIHALKNINLHVKPGEIFGVIGKSGAGKSTLIRCVNLLEHPTQGRVIIDQQDLSDLSTEQLRIARHKIGMIFQHFNLLSSRTTFDNIALPIEFSHLTKKEIKARVALLMELTGLHDKAHAYPAQLSGGQKQRVAIARALAHQPKVLLSDEATSALDPQTTQTILQLLKNINQQLGLTILLITHEMNVIKTTADRVALIDHGEIIEETETARFFTDPQTSLAKTFVYGSLKQELPAAIQEQLKTEPTANHNPILRLIFKGHAASEALIAHLMQELNMTLNILQANIEFLKQSILGVMVVEVISGQEQISNAIKFLAEKKVFAEIIGYVERNVI